MDIDKWELADYFYNIEIPKSLIGSILDYEENNLSLIKKTSRINLFIGANN